MGIESIENEGVQLYYSELSIYDLIMGIESIENEGVQFYYS